VKKSILLLSTLLVLTQPAFAENVWDPKQSPTLAEKPLNITVYRSESCGCCKDWLNHLKKHNFVIEDITNEDINAVKLKLGLPTQLASCHTAVIDGYVIEGHVPAQDIKQLIQTKPDNIAGLSVPQMPHGTPGMETGRKDDFYVVAFDKQGKMDAFNVYQDY
jgi:hypothetical protein